jgi:hypothetical protein
VESPLNAKKMILAGAFPFRDYKKKISSMMTVFARTVFWYNMEIV